MEDVGVDQQLVAWTTDYLTNRPQHVRLQAVVCSTGALQGPVLSPFLFSLYTSDFRHNSEQWHLQKFSGDTVNIG